MSGNIHDEILICEKSNVAEFAQHWTETLKCVADGI